MSALYLHDSILLCPTMHGMGMTAIEDIEKGAILSIDKLLIGTHSKLINTAPILMKDSIPQLFPRDGTVQDKLDHVCFSYSSNVHRPLYALGHYISFFNHCCNPNAFVGIIHAGKSVFAIVVATRDISINQEIFLSYDEMLGHEVVSPFHKFQCSCPLSYTERQILWKNNRELWTSCYHTPLSQKIIEQCLQKDNDNHNEMDWDFND